MCPNEPGVAMGTNGTGCPKLYLDSTGDTNLDNSENEEAQITNIEATNVETSMLLGVTSIGFIVLILLIFVFSVMGRRKTKPDYNFTEMNPIESYVQQLVLLGYSEDAARTHAKSKFPVPSLLPPIQTTNPRLEEYVQQLIAQGYPEATARAHAEQHKEQF